MVKKFVLFLYHRPFLGFQILFFVFISLFLPPPRLALSLLNSRFQILDQSYPPLDYLSQIKIPPYPAHTLNQPLPTLTAKAFLVKDLDSKVVMAAYNPNKILPMASLTKLMTALVALQTYPPKSVIPITIDADLVDGQKIGLKAGEEYSLEALVAAAIINSANDAALNLAAFHPQGIPGFVQAMNVTAKQLNMSNTHFTNPVGYDNPYHYSTVTDLSFLADAVLNNPLITAFAQTPLMRMVEINTGRVITLKTTNNLLGQYPGILGLKTGWTQNAGECLISLVESNQNHWYLVIILGSQDRFGETLLLKNWVDQNIKWVNLSSLYL